ncbi:response regulator transcription factor [Anoxybacterium hadale]|uniref:Response regulator transcription factor n=1 Tax=Anoxybacterium hadale TaxID=3408580 RepID=A0ACD1AFD9_9FIRM|nr:response regulator transcription factor [Clostridiales bacterium]
MGRILIVEDDIEISMLERDYLEINGFEADIISDGSIAVQTALSGEYDLILLDLMLPGCNGYEICRELRDRIDIPILMVTARSESVDKIRGLGLGADDYIAKPFDPAELVARIKSHLNRYERLKGALKGGTAAVDDAIIIGDLKILPRSWKVYKGDEEIRLPNREFELLKFLAENADLVFSKEQLFEKIWGYEYVGDSATVTVHINRIREKIEEDPSKPHIIETVWGAGYRLNRQN